ncbi:hypothetical protein H4N54_10050, partial [Limnospira fusiformis KN01]|uniref:hypothetical protein n=1 Tax=Limnospira fusiformis TaxID=54297 RepID=UPI001CA64CC9
ASNLHFLASPTPPITLTLIREFAGDARVFFRRFEGGLTKLPKCASGTIKELSLSMLDRPRGLLTVSAKGLAGLTNLEF